MRLNANIQKLRALILRNKGFLQESLDTLKKCYLMNEKNPEYLKHICKSLFLLIINLIKELFFFKCLKGKF